MGFCLLVRNPKVRNLLFGWSPHTPYTSPLYSGKKCSKRTNLQGLLVSSTFLMEPMDSLYHTSAGFETLEIFPTHGPKGPTLWDMGHLAFILPVVRRKEHRVPRYTRIRYMGIRSQRDEARKQGKGHFRGKVTHFMRSLTRWTLNSLVSLISFILSPSL